MGCASLESIALQSGVLGIGVKIASGLSQLMLEKQGLPVDTKAFADYHLVIVLKVEVMVRVTYTLLVSCHRWISAYAT